MAETYLFLTANLRNVFLLILDLFLTQLLQLLAFAIDELDDHQ